MMYLQTNKQSRRRRLENRNTNKQINQQTVAEEEAGDGEGQESLKRNVLCKH